MKNTLLLAILAGSFVLPAYLHADPPVSKAKRAAKTTAAANAAAAKAAAAQPRETNYITRTPVTGSHIPNVWRTYDGRAQSASDLRVYNQHELNRTGQLDVASELTLVDPSITSTRGR